MKRRFIFNLLSRSCFYWFLCTLVSFSFRRNDETPNSPIVSARSSTLHYHDPYEAMYATKRGKEISWCIKCGQQLYARSASFGSYDIPLTIEGKVENGRCLNCNPDLIADQQMQHKSQIDAEIKQAQQSDLRIQTMQQDDDSTVCIEEFEVSCEKQEPQSTRTCDSFRVTNHCMMLSLLLSVAGFVLSILSLVSCHFFYFYTYGMIDSYISTYFGLFQLKQSTNESCLSFETNNFPSSFTIKCVRFFGVIAAIIAGVAMVYMVSLTRSVAGKTSWQAVGFMLIVASVLQLSTFCSSYYCFEINGYKDIVRGEEKTCDYVRLGSGSYLNIAAFMCHLVDAILIFVMGPPLTPLLKADRYKEGRRLSPLDAEGCTPPPSHAFQFPYSAVSFPIEAGSSFGSGTEGGESSRYERPDPAALLHHADDEDEVT